MHSQDEMQNTANQPICYHAILLVLMKTCNLKASE